MTTASTLRAAALLAACAVPDALAAPATSAASLPTGTHLQDEDPVAPTWRDFEKAVSLAREDERFALVVWAQRDRDDPAAPLAGILDDAEVRRWITERGVLSYVDVRQNNDAAARNGVRTIEIPCLDIVRADGLRVDRLRRGATATDFLATVIGYSSVEPVERPEGEAAREPFRWLAWGNQRFNAIDADAGPDATEAYRWLLTSAEAYRPGFRARFLEFLINRLNQNRPRHDGAAQTLVHELNSLRSLIVSGDATRRDVYEYTRFAHWLRQEADLATLFVELGEDAGEGRAPGRARARLWLLDAAAPMLARAREHAAIGDLLGDDPGSYFRRRIAALPADATDAPDAGADGADAEPEAPAPAPDPGPDPDFAPLEHAIPDSASEIHEDAGWVYYALLDAGRGADAAAVLRDVARALPGVGVYAACANRAVELGALDEAERVIAEGRADVGEDSRRLRRIEQRIEGVRERARRERAEPGDGDGEGGDGRDGAPRG